MHKPFLRLKHVLTIPFILITSFFALGAGYFTWTYSEDAILSLGEQLSKQSLLIAQDEMRDLLDRPYEMNLVVKEALKNKLIKKNEKSKLHNYIKSIVVDNNDIDTLGFGFADGSYISYGHSTDGNLIKNSSSVDGERIFYSYKMSKDSKGNDVKQEVHRRSNYDARMRPWFSEALAIKKPVWSSVFSMYSTGFLGITLSEAVFDTSGDFLGVVGSDVVFNFLNQKLHNIKLTPNSLIYIVDGDDNLIAYNSDDSKIPSTLYKVDKSGNELIKTSYALVKQLGKDELQFTFEDLTLANQSGRYFIHFMPRVYSKSLNWHLAVVIPENDFFEKINKIKSSIFWIWVVSLLVSLFFGLWAAVFIVKSINRLRNKVTHIEDIDDIDLESHRIQELHGLARTFFIMSERLKKALKEVKQSNLALEEKVQARTKELHTANDKLLKLSNTDSLTQIPNRRYFEQSLLDRFSELKQGEIEVLSLLVCDVDHFKQYNDTYGHQAGDECLKEVAGVMKSSVRKSDTAARYGGEEFAVILPDASSHIAKKVADKIIEDLVAKKIPHSNSSVSSYVSLSIGIATTTLKQGLTTDELIKGADQALYMAKSQGRNQSQVYVHEANSQN